MASAGAQITVASINIFYKTLRSSQNPLMLQKMTQGQGVGQRALSHIAGRTAVWGGCYGGKFDKLYQNDKGYIASDSVSLIPGILL